MNNKMSRKIKQGGKYLRFRFVRKAAAVICAAAMALSACGCSGSIGSEDETVSVNLPDENSQSSVTRAYLPIKKEGGGKFKLAYVDIDPYNETFRMLYYVIESLKDDGWISYDSLPFDPETDDDSQALINWLADNAESEYMEFDKTANYYTSVSSEEEIYESLKQHIEVDNDIDAILSMGTSPSVMLQKFGFDVPLLMYAVSDPIGSGLIESAENSGNENYWAHVDSSAYSRQMQYYYDTFEFSNIGSVYGDEIVAALPDYRSIAEKNGFTITEYQLDKDSFDDEDVYYTQLKAIYSKMINVDKIDAYILNTNVITSVDKAKEMMQVFFDNNIPVFVQVGSAYVKEGAALLIVDPRDAEGTGPFVSNIIGSVFNGAKPGDLEQEYISSPYLTLNLDVADEIDFKPSFEMLIACEKIICTE
jgi:ABC-type uncharacterized transport system substrate-binding protein